MKQEKGKDIKAKFEKDNYPGLELLVISLEEIAVLCGCNCTSSSDNPWRD